MSLTCEIPLFDPLEAEKEISLAEFAKRATSHDEELRQCVHCGALVTYFFCACRGKGANIRMSPTFLVTDEGAQAAFRLGGYDALGNYLWEKYYES